MSILIKGMEMPECCDVCTFSDWSNLHQTACCKLTGYESCFDDFSHEYNKRRSDDCPLVALPEKHGRLIDANVLMNIFADRLEKMPEWYGINSAVAGAVSGAMKLLYAQPTVIEAEEEE